MLCMTETQPSHAVRNTRPCHAVHEMAFRDVDDKLLTRLRRSLLFNGCVYEG